MPDDEIKAIAEAADFIVSGYSFTLKEDGFISILNLNHPDCAMVINQKCELIETNMDEIEQKIVLSLAEKNMQFFGESNA